MTDPAPQTERRSQTKTGYRFFVYVPRRDTKSRKGNHQVLPWSYLSETPKKDGGNK